MSEHHPYDKWLGEKLKKLPAPDSDKSWPGMRRLLDEEMPEGGGYSKRRGGWWLFGAVLIFIIAGSWTLLTMNFSRQNVDPPLTNTQNTSPPGTANADIADQSEKPVTEDDKILHSSIQQDRRATTSIDGEPLTGSRSAPEQPGGKADGEILAVSAGISEKDWLITDHEITRSGGGSGKLKPGKGGKNKSQDPVSTGDVNTNGDPGAANLPGATEVLRSEPGFIAAGEGDAVKYATINGILPIPVGSVASGYDSVSSAHADKVEYTSVSRKYYRQHKKYGTPANVKAPYSTFGRSFAIGFSLPLGFPLGDQKMLGYNINAGGNTVSDYLPAPHLQYHFNGKSYIQSEIQLMSPQFIRPVLLYQDYHSNSNYSTTSSIYARKLYYFNLPVSMHYSPFKHFYMGTGLQFSSLIGGVALHEQINTGAVPGGSIYNARYAKFSNDSISNKLNGNEMRLMLDANYYWHKFTVGLRYNQALSNYVNTRAASALPYTLDKNKSLQFYMRYNLWEEKRWKARNTRSLSLK